MYLGLLHSVQSFLHLHTLYLCNFGLNGLKNMYCLFICIILVLILTLMRSVTGNMVGDVMAFMWNVREHNIRCNYMNIIHEQMRIMVYHVGFQPSYGFICTFFDNFNFFRYSDYKVHFSCNINRTLIFLLC